MIIKIEMIEITIIKKMIIKMIEIINNMVITEIPMEKMSIIIDKIRY